MEIMFRSRIGRRWIAVVHVGENIGHVGGVDVGLFPGAYLLSTRYGMRRGGYSGPDGHSLTMKPHPRQGKRCLGRSGIAS